MIRNIIFPKTLHATRLYIALLLWFYMLDINNTYGLKLFEIMLNFQR